MTGVLRILVLDPLAGPEPLRAPRGMQVHRCPDTADLLGRALAGAADVVLVSPLAAGMDASVVARIRGAGCRVAGLVHNAQDNELAARIGLVDIVAWPVDAALLQRLAASPPAVSGPSAGERGGLVLAVWGPPGSPGRTTVAALLAVGAHRAGLRTLLVDADTLAPQWSLMARARGDLTVAMRRAAHGELGLQDLVDSPAVGLSVLVGAPDPGRWVESDPALVPALLRACAEQHEVVVLDTAADIRHAHPAYDIGWAHDSAAVGRAVLAACDAVVPVLSADPLGVHRFATWWPLLAERTASEVVVANRMGWPRAGRHPGAQIAQVLAAVGAPAARIDIEWNPKAADRLLSSDWHRASGWRDAPERLWRAVAQQGARLPAVRESGSLAS